MSRPSLRAAAETPVRQDRHRGLPLPWWFKLGTKLALGALRVPPPLLRRLGINRHSFEESGRARLLDPLAAQVERFTALAGRPPRGWLELGPARMVARAPIAAALGLSPILYLDVEDDSPREVGPYLAAAEMARAAGLHPPDLAGVTGPAEVLARCNARLLIGGPGRLAEIPEGSLDLITSEAVLEHVRRDAVPALLSALRRAGGPDSLHIHRVDLRDHMGGGRRHLGFPGAFWEGAAVARSGIYTNRLGATAWLAAFRDAGFAPELAWAEHWAAPPPGRPHPDTGHGPEDARFAAIEIAARGG